MSITLRLIADPLPDLVPLDPDLFWSDEIDYSPVQMAVDVSLTGALIVQADGDATRPGRPITLSPIDEGSAWMIRADLETLDAWAAIPDAKFTLTLRGVARTVMFRHQEPPALSAKPVMHYSDVLDSDYYLVTFKFMEI
ncbi:hypothetical protein BH11PSE13_BH11PSE13_12150 [soil metagenome]